MFARRLFLYSIGFFLGCVFVYFLFFKGKNRSFFPSAIVLDTLTSKEIVIDEKEECILACVDISKDQLKILMKNGEVVFSESSPQEVPKKYVVQIEINKKKTKLLFELSNAQSKLVSVIMSVEDTCNCE